MRRPLALLCAPLLAIVVSACGSSSVSTSAFTGEQHQVAQTISNLQSNATAAEEKKICTDDLSRALVKRLGGTKGCEATIKSQLVEVDNLEVSVQSVQLPSTAKGTAAQAQVRSIHSGKTEPSTVSLVKEGGKWKISGLQ